MTPRPTIHLVCNSHIDPVWLWEWEEGVAEALSTFRAAAELCEEFDGFVFNHNEAVLYRWVEEFEPELFERIRRLVREGRWHIMRTKLVFNMGIWLPRSMPPKVHLYIISSY